MSDPERAARYSDLFEGGHRHPSDACAYCPICSAISVVRSTKPEVMDHLASAARELILAAGLFLEEAGQAIGSQEPRGQAPSEPTEPPKIRRIDIG
jgi:hypothetical protein